MVDLSIKNRWTLLKNKSKSYWNMNSIVDLEYDSYRKCPLNLLEFEFELSTIQFIAPNHLSLVSWDSNRDLYTSAFCTLASFKWERLFLLTNLLKAEFLCIVNVNEQLSNVSFSVQTWSWLVLPSISLLGCGCSPHCTWLLVPGN